jgi:hypothetical protein
VWEQLGIFGDGVRVATLDTGVAIDHPDLEGRMVTDDPGDPTFPGGWMEFDEDGNLVSSEPHDSALHGTHVAGTIHGGDDSEQRQVRPCRPMRRRARWCLVTASGRPRPLSRSIRLADLPVMLPGSPRPLRQGDKQEMNGQGGQVQQRDQQFDQRHHHGHEETYEQFTDRLHRSGSRT